VLQVVISFVISLTNFTLVYSIQRLCIQHIKDTGILKLGGTVPNLFMVKGHNSYWGMAASKKITVRGIFVLNRISYCVHIIYKYDS